MSNVVKPGLPSSWQAVTCSEDVAGPGCSRMLSNLLCWGHPIRLAGDAQGKGQSSVPFGFFFAFQGGLLLLVSPWPLQGDPLLVRHHGCGCVWLFLSAGAYRGLGASRHAQLMPKVALQSSLMLKACET